MNKRNAIIVIRTVSVEKLSPVLDACRARWPDGPITVVSSAGRAEELRSDARVRTVVEYEARPDGFAAPIVVPGEPAALVIPVNNRTGSGYANVLRACRQVRARERFLAPHCRGLARIGAVRWAIKIHLEPALAVPARWIGRLWAARILRIV